MKSTDRKNKKRTGLLSSIIILIAALDLLLLYYFKYNNQGLPFADFDIKYIGNILNLIFTLLVITGVIFYTFFGKHGYKKGFLIASAVILNIMLLSAIISAKINLPLPSYYLFDHPFSKIFTGILFSAYQFLLIIFLSVLWYSVIGRELVVLRALLNSAAIAVILLAFTFVYINSGKIKKINKNKPGKKYNVAVVLGAAVWSHNSPSPSLAARVDKAFELYKKGVVNKIQLTGSNAPGELSEAEVAYNYLKTEDIDNSDVWLEKNTVSTAEQIRFIRDSLLTKRNVGSVVIVSDAYHLTRVGEMCRFYRIKAGLAPSGLKLSFEHSLYYKLKESVALLVFWLFGL